MKEFKNFDSGKISWFRCGGKISVFCIVENIKELTQCLNTYKEYNNNLIVLGAGSNILIRDSGFKGLAIKLAGDFNKLELIDNDKIVAGSCVLSKTLANFALKNNLIGGEFLDSIPGTIGGEIFMNAGCFGKEIKDIFVECKCLIDGKIKMFNKKTLTFGYRHSSLPQNAIILDAIFQFKKGGIQEIEMSKQTLQEFQQHRKTNQIIGATCGSTFANPINKDGEKISAWKLIEAVGLRGVEIDGAKFSEKHCNFLINTGTATATSIENLINLAKTKIKEKFDIDMTTEIRIIG